MFIVGHAAGQGDNDLTSKAPGVYAWDDALRNMAVQIFRPFPPDDVLRISVGEFREARTGKRLPLSKLIESNLETVVGQVENVELITTKGHDSELDERVGRVDLRPRYILLGLYRLGPQGLRINAVLQEHSSGRKISSSRVIIRRTDLNPQDLVMMEKETEPPNAFNEKGFDDYQFAVDNLLATEPKESLVKVEVWTDKYAYQIGEQITFYFRSNRDAYVTLIDVGTSGEMRILFPNRFQRGSFVTAGETYAIPSPTSGFTIKVDGPPGLERVKVIATPEPLASIKLNLTQAFDVFLRDDNRRTQDLKVTAKGLEDLQWADDYIEIYVTEDGEMPAHSGRARTIKPKPRPEPPEKPIDIIGVPGVKSQPESARGSVETREGE